MLDPGLPGATCMPAGAELDTDASSHPPQPSAGAEAICTIAPSLASYAQQLASKSAQFEHLHGRPPHRPDIEADADWSRLFSDYRDAERGAAEAQRPGGCSVFIARRRRFCSHAAASGLQICSEHVEAANAAAAAAATAAATPAAAAHAAPATAAAATAPDHEACGLLTASLEASRDLTSNEPVAATDPSTDRSKDLSTDPGTDPSTDPCGISASKHLHLSNGIDAAMPHREHRSSGDASPGDPAPDSPYNAAAGENPSWARKSNLKRRMKRCSNPLARQFLAPFVPPRAWSEVFADTSLPLLLDIGCAKGRWLGALASCPAFEAKHGKHNFLGVELFAPLVSEANTWRDGAGLHNLHFMAASINVAFTDLVASLPSPGLSKVCVQFPDPWRADGSHAGRRMLTPNLARQITESLRPGCECFVVSDVLAVAEDMRSLMLGTGGMELHPMHHSDVSGKQQKAVLQELEQLEQSGQLQQLEQSGQLQQLEQSGQLQLLEQSGQLEQQQQQQPGKLERQQQNLEQFEQLHQSEQLLQQQAGQEQSEDGLRERSKAAPGSEGASATEGPGHAHGALAGSTDTFAPEQCWGPQQQRLAAEQQECRVLAQQPGSDHADGGREDAAPECVTRGVGGAGAVGGVGGGTGDVAGSSTDPAEEVPRGVSPRVALAGDMWLESRPYGLPTERDKVCEALWRPVYRTLMVRI